MGIPSRQERLVESNCPTHRVGVLFQGRPTTAGAAGAMASLPSSGATASPPPSVELQVTVRRLQGSLGFGVDKNNTVVAMKADGAAVRDGLLQRGDQVVAVDGRLLGGRNMAQEIQSDESVFMLTILRRDAALCTSLGRLPPKHLAASTDALLHLARATVTRGGKEPLGLEMSSSNVVKRLLENGPAMRGGIQLADVVVAVNGTWLADRRVVDVLAQAAASPIAFTVVRAESRQQSDAGADVAGRPRQMQPPSLGPPPAMLLVEGEHYQLSDPHGRPPDFAAVAMRDKSHVSVRQADGRNIDACARAMREAKFWRALSPRGTKPCPAILAFYGQQLVAGSLYTVTEPYIETLAAAFRRRPDMPMAQIQTVATELMRGLAFMHDTCRLVHCNIGLDTLALCANGGCKILSFSSVARSTGVRSSCAHLIEKSPSVRYVSLAPELVDETGAAHVGPGVDLFAAGVVIATLLNRRESPLTEPHELSLPAIGGDAAANVLRETAALCLEADLVHRPRAAALLSYLTNSTAGQGDETVELRLNVVVKRGAKGLGIGVNRGNIIQSLTAGHVLQLGDEIVSVDGVHLAGRHMSHVLKPEAPSYEMVVVRRDQVCGTFSAPRPSPPYSLHAPPFATVSSSIVLRYVVVSSSRSPSLPVCSSHERAP
jgi:serine/threonine protein kinase